MDDWGDVVEIGTSTTRILTPDNRVLVIPNSDIGNSRLFNYTYPDPRYRIQTEVGVAYGTDLRLVRQVISESLKGVEGIIPDKPVDVLFMEWGDSEMVLRVRWWIESYVNARRSTDRINEHIYQALEAAGVDMPFPTMSVEILNNNPEQNASLLVERKEDE